MKILKIESPDQTKRNTLMILVIYKNQERGLNSLPTFIRRHLGEIPFSNLKLIGSTGDNSISNTRLLCSSHNKLEAKIKMKTINRGKLAGVKMIPYESVVNLGAG